MGIDAESIRRMIREDREEAERKAADRAEREELRGRIAKLEARKPEPKEDHEAEPGDDHPFEL